jgi:hypothetical protein
LYGKDIERILSVVNRIKDWTADKIEALSYEADYRLNTIDHVHTVHIGTTGKDPNSYSSSESEGHGGKVAAVHTGSPEGTPSGPHGHPDGCHVNDIDLLFTGRDDPPATDYRSPDNGHTGKDHFWQVSDQRTYPIAEERGYLRDLHNHHKHIEPSMVYEREHIEMAAPYVAQYVNTPICLEEPRCPDQCGQHRCVDKGTYHQCWACDLESNCDELCSETCQHQCVKNHPTFEYKNPCWRRPAFNTLADELQKELCQFKVLQRHQYVGVEQFNNNYGSPWTEMYNLKKKMNIALKYANDFPELQWIGEKHTLMSLLQIVLTYAVEAKYAITIYHNWIQQAYDHKFNSNEPSVTWEDFVHGETIGEINQPIKENVRVRKEDEDTPF